MEELRLEAKAEKLSEVLAFVDERLEAADCPLKAQMQIDVAVEELFVNVAYYAYPGGAGDVVIAMEIRDGTAVIRLMDSGLPFNPLDRPDPDVKATADKRKIGGLGIYMAKKSMDSMDYQHTGGMNVLTMSKRIG